MTKKSRFVGEVSDSRSKIVGVFWGNNFDELCEEVRRGMKVDHLDDLYSQDLCLTWVDRGTFDLKETDPL